MLSQVQIIRSLGEALGWLEKELEWGAPVAELRHLTGRIGELYAAMLTRGQMANSVNQQGYDVVGFYGEHISVKTVTTSLRAPFNPRTLDLVDRIMVFRIDIDAQDGVAIETLLDILRPEFGGHLRYLANGQIDFPIRATREAARPLQDQILLIEAKFEAYVIRQYESGTVAVSEHGNAVPTAMPILRKIAAKLGIDLLNGNGGQKNTRQLGAGIINAINSQSL